MLYLDMPENVFTVNWSMSRLTKQSCCHFCSFPLEIQCERKGRLYQYLYAFLTQWKFFKSLKSYLSNFEQLILLPRSDNDLIKSAIYFDNPTIKKA